MFFFIIYELMPFDCHCSINFEFVCTATQTYYSQPPSESLDSRILYLHRLALPRLNRKKRTYIRPRYYYAKIFPVISSTKCPYLPDGLNFSLFCICYEERYLYMVVFVGALMVAPTVTTFWARMEIMLEKIMLKRMEGWKGWLGDYNRDREASFNAGILHTNNIFGIEAL